VDYKQQQLIRWKTARPLKTIWMLLIISWVLFLLPFCGISFVGWILNFMAFRNCIQVISLGNKTGGLVPLLSSLTLSPIMFIIGLLMFTFLEPERPQPVEPPPQKHIQPAQPQPHSTRQTNVWLIKHMGLLKHAA